MIQRLTLLITFLFIVFAAKAQSLKYNVLRPTTATSESKFCSTGSGFEALFGGEPKPSSCEVTIETITAGEAEIINASEKPIKVVPDYRVDLSLNGGGVKTTILSEGIGDKVNLTATVAEGSLKLTLFGKNKYEKIECVVNPGESKVCSGNLLLITKQYPKKTYQYFQVQPTSPLVKGIKFDVVRVD